MTELAACYFCGRGPDEALGEYGVVPSAFEPSADQQISVVLCPTCRDKLRAVLDRVVAASDATAQPTGGPSAAATSAADDLVDATVDLDDAVDQGGAAGSGGATRGAAAGDEDPDRAGGAGPTSDADSTPSRTPAGGEAATDEGDGISFGGRSRAADEGADAGDGSGGASPGGSSAGETEASGSTGGEAGTSGSTSAGTDESGSPSTGSSAGTGSSPGGGTSGRGGRGGAGGGDDELLGSNADTYRKVIRLLQNRDFPVNREEIATIAANAYDLTPQEANSAIDTVVQKGLLVEENGVLRKG